VNIFPVMIALAIYRDRLTARWRPFLALSIATAATFVAMWFSHPEWLVASPSEFATHVKMWSEPTFRALDVVALSCWYVFYNVQNSAIGFLPLAAGALGMIGSLRARKHWLILAVCTAFMLIGATNLARRGVAWPYYTTVHCCEITEGNIITNFGLGPPTLTDVWSGIHPYPFHLSFAARVVAGYATVLIAAAAAALLLSAVRRFQQPRSNLLFVIGALSALVGSAALIVAGQYFDRYALDSAWPVGLLLPLVLDWSDKRLRAATIALLVVVAIFSTFSVQEYFAWNRARWTAYWDLRNRGIGIREIDGGAEPYLYFELSKARTPQERRKMAFGGGKREYLLAFAPVEGFTTIAARPFRGWLGLHHGQVLTLRRRPATGTSG
jgi:hypothetical protein